MLEDKELPWTRERAYAIRDSNLDNNRSAEQYFKFGRAKSVEELLAAMQTSQGVAWVNTIAADRHGKALYADLSVVPNVDEALIKRCSSTAISRWREAPTVVLKASADCEWRNDARAQQSGILPPQQLPSLIRDDYVTNSNDSYWLSNPAQPLEGFSPIIGAERTARSLRTRAGLVLVNEVLEAQANNKYDAERLQNLLFNHRNYGAELALDDVLAICARESKGQSPFPAERKMGTVPILQSTSPLRAVCWPHGIAVRMSAVAARRSGRNSGRWWTRRPTCGVNRSM